jgi:hypothetical protein
MRGDKFAVALHAPHHFAQDPPGDNCSACDVCLNP